MYCPKINSFDFWCNFVFQWFWKLLSITIHIWLLLHETSIIQVNISPKTTKNSGPVPVRSGQPDFCFNSGPVRSGCEILVPDGY